MDRRLVDWHSCMYIQVFIHAVDCTFGANISLTDENSHSSEAEDTSFTSIIKDPYDSGSREA